MRALRYMDFLPKEIEDLIIDYKTDLEHTENLLKIKKIITDLTHTENAYKKFCEENKNFLKNHKIVSFGTFNSDIYCKQCGNHNIDYDNDDTTSYMFYFNCKYDDNKQINREIDFYNNIRQCDDGRREYGSKYIFDHYFSEFYDSKKSKHLDYETDMDGKYCLNRINTFWNKSEEKKVLEQQIKEERPQPVPDFPKFIPLKNDLNNSEVLAYNSMDNYKLLPFI